MSGDTLHERLATRLAEDWQREEDAHAVTKSELQRYRTALERLTSPSWHTNIEADMLAADDVDGVYAAAHAAIDEVMAIAREALKEAK